jgi:Mg/Co/Ni transporter MgtE
VCLLYIQAANLMARHKLHHLPVVDENDIVVSMLSTEDVLKDLLHIVQFLPSSEEEVAL